MDLVGLGWCENEWVALGWSEKLWLGLCGELVSVDARSESDDNFSEHACRSGGLELFRQFTR